MGELKVGDMVWGADGKPTKVTFATEIMHNHKCYEITFADGEKVIADADHNWCITKRGMNNDTKVMTTEEIFNSVWKRVRTDGKGTEYIVRIPVNKPTLSEDIDLPVDPYALGCWLADGHLHKPIISSADYDVEMYERVSAIYGEPKLYHDKRTRAVDIKYTGEKGKNNSKFRHALEDAGVLHFKHIPEIYLRAGTQQRWDLLRGFMDCDGYIEKRGQCEFTQKSVEVTDGICEILSSLGITYTRTTKIPKLNGKECDEVQRVQFFTDKMRPCFTLQRKFERLKDRLNKRMDFKSIVDIQPTESVPVRCITVDNADHLFLFGKRYSVTHNSALCALITLWFLICDGEPSPEIALSANSRDQAAVLYEFVKVWAHQVDPSGKDLKILRNGIECLPNNGKITVFAADATRIDGRNISLFVQDEYGGARTSDNYDVLRSAQGQRKNPLGIVITTCGFNLNSPFKKMYDTYVEILHGIKEDDATFIQIYALDDGDNYADEKNWPKIAPNLGVTVSNKYLNEQVVYAKNNPSAEVGVLTKNFNMWCQTSTTWIPDSYIQKSMQAVNLDDFKDDDIVFGGVDLSSTGDLTCVSFLLTKEDDERLYFKNLYYLPESALMESPNKQLYQYWHRQGFLTLTSGNVVDYDYILADIMRVYEKLSVRKLGLDRWNASSFQISATEEGLPIEPVSQSIANLNRPTKELERLIRSGKVIIDNNEINLFCFRNAKPKFDWNENIKITKENYEAKIDGVVAMIIALCTYLDTPRFSGSILAL